MSDYVPYASCMRCTLSSCAGCSIAEPCSTCSLPSCVGCPFVFDGTEFDEIGDDLECATASIPLEMLKQDS